MFAFALTSTRTHRPKQAEAKRKGCKVPALGEVFANAGQKSNLLTSVSLAGALCQLAFSFAATKYPTQSNPRDGLFWLSGGGDSLSWWQGL